MSIHKQGEYSRRLKALADEMGWQIEGLTGRAHVKLVRQGCRAVTCSYTPTNAKFTLYKVRRDLRRAMENVA